MNKSFSIIILLIILANGFQTVSAENECLPEVWATFEGDKLYKSASSNNYVFSTKHKAFDADGAPNAYHPDDTGLDYLANAGYPKHSYWRKIFVLDPENPKVPYRQKEGEFAGYFIAKTALADRRKKETDIERYVDARKIPYLVFPGNFSAMKGTGKLGDYGIAYNRKTKMQTPFVVADIGPPSNPLGEMSMALGEALGGSNINPKNSAGAPSGEIIYAVFYMSSKQYKWPQKMEDFESITSKLLKADQGLVDLLDCVKK